MKETFCGHQIVTGERSLYDMSNSKDIIAGPGYTHYKRLAFFFFSPRTPNHSYANLKTKKEKEKMKQVWSVKIDKRDKLLKVVECPFWMEKRLFWSDTKGDMLKK